MIINVFEKVLSPEALERLKDAEREESEYNILEIGNKTPEELTDNDWVLLKKWEKANDERKKILINARLLYMKTRTREQLFEDLKDILKNIGLDDFNNAQIEYERLLKEEKENQIIKLNRELGVEDLIVKGTGKKPQSDKLSLVAFVYSACRTVLNLLNDDDFGKACNIIAKKVISMQRDIKRLQAASEGAQPGETAIRPRGYNLFSDLVSERIFDDLQTRDLNTMAPNEYYDPIHINKAQKIDSLVTIDFEEIAEEGEGIIKIPKLNRIDKCIYEAICSLYIAGNRIMSLNMIYKAVTGKPPTDHTPAPLWFVNAVREALVKFRGTFKCTLIENGEKVKSYDESLLIYVHCSEVINNKDMEDPKLNGQTIREGIVLPKDKTFMPVLLKWAGDGKGRGKVIKLDITIHDIPGLRYDERSLLIERYLLGEICKKKETWTKNAREAKKKGQDAAELPPRERSIRFDTMYKVLDLGDFNRVINPELSPKEQQKLDISRGKEKAEIRSIAERCLSYWKEKQFIADYSYTKDKPEGKGGRPEIRGVEVFFCPKGTGNQLEKSSPEKSLTEKKSKTRSNTPGTRRKSSKTQL